MSRLSRSFKNTFTMVAVAVFIVPMSVFAAGGELIWTQTENNQIGGTDEATAVAIDSSGIYVAGGGSWNQINNHQLWQIEKRSLTTGAILWTQTEDPGVGNPAGVAVDSSGIYVAGGGWDDWRIEKRSLTTGAILWTQTENPSINGSDAATAVAVDSSGIYVVGYDSSPGSNMGWRIEKRSLTTGAILWTQTENPSNGSDMATGVAVDSSGIYVVGFDQSQSVGNQYRIEKRSLTTGAILWTQTENPSNGSDAATAVAIDSSGIYVAGYDEITNQQWRIEKRSLTTGAILWTQTENTSSIWEQPLDIIADSSGVYVAGYSYPYSNTGWRIEKRSLTTGAILWIQDESPARIAYGVAVDSSGIYVVGDDINSTDNQSEWRIEKRYTAAQPNQPPTAVITEPTNGRTVASGTPISFDGSNSTDPDGILTAYTWRDGACSSGTFLFSSDTFSKSDLSTGAHTIYLTVTDDQGAVSTNCPSVTVTVTPPPLPDLTASVVTPTTATAGTAVTLSSTISNQGSASTGASFSNFFQIATAAGGGGTITDLAATTMTALSAGASNTATKSYTFPSVGTYSARACADKSSSGNMGTIDEGVNEDNNCSSPWTSINVTIPTLTLTASPNPVPYNNPTTLTWTTANMTSCTASGGWSGSKTATDGTHSSATSNITSTKTYTLACTGSDGSTTSKSVTVTVSSVCGDGVITGSEQCDGASLNGQTCTTQGYTGGTLSCTSSCTYDTSACTTSGPLCGNNICEQGEPGVCRTDCPYDIEPI